MRTILANRLLGVCFIGLLVGGILLVYAVFQQKFISFDKVTLHTDTIGLQLPAQADVKVRGVIVGEVTKAEAEENGAVLTLGIRPNKIGEIPDNVTASIVPKTLFGEKYVELDIPKAASSKPLRTGDVITQTKTPIEVEKVLRDLYPLLRTVQPAELDYTLSAIANALEGRGQKIGESIVTLDNYLKRINPEVPALVSDVRLLAKDSALYADVVPQVAETLRNTVKTSGTLESKQVALHAFLQNVRGLSDTADAFLQQNGDNIIQLGKLSRPQVALLKTYSPEYSCLLKGIVGQLPRLTDTFRGFTFHISLHMLPRQPRGYTTADKAVFGAKNPPTCAGLPNPPGNAEHPYGSPGVGPSIPNIRDGVDDHGGTLGRGDNQRPATSFGTTTSGRMISGSAMQRRLIAALAAPALGVPADQVPGVTDLLFAPVAAGTEVSTR